MKKSLKQQQEDLLKLEMNLIIQAELLVEKDKLQEDFKRISYH